MVTFLPGRQIAPLATIKEHVANSMKALQATEAKRRAKAASLADAAKVSSANAS